jgi:hypothetical protein
LLQVAHTHGKLEANLIFTMKNLEGKTRNGVGVPDCREEKWRFSSLK